MDFKILLFNNKLTGHKVLLKKKRCKFRDYIKELFK